MTPADLDRLDDAGRPRCHLPLPTCPKAVRLADGTNGCTFDRACCFCFSDDDPSAADLVAKRGTAPVWEGGDDDE